MLNTTDSQPRVNANISRQRPKWVHENASQFCDNIDTQMIHDLCADLHQQVVTGDITQNAVDSVVSRLSTIFVNSSQKNLENTKNVLIKAAGQIKTSPGSIQRVGLLDNITTMHVKSLITQKLTVINVTLNKHPEAIKSQ